MAEREEKTGGEDLFALPRIPLPRFAALISETLILKFLQAFLPPILASFSHFRMVGDRQAKNQGSAKTQGLGIPRGQLHQPEVGPLPLPREVSWCC